MEERKMGGLNEQAKETLESSILQESGAKREIKEGEGPDEYPRLTTWPSFALTRRGRETITPGRVQWGRVVVREERGGEGRAVAVGVAGGGGTAGGGWEGGWRQRRQTLTRATE
jgi:hypothetical protein